MRATEFITEIERLNKDSYTGGKRELNDYKSPEKKQLKPLPGGSGFMYATKPSSYSGTTYIFIIDPKHVENTLSRQPSESVAEFIKRAKEVQRTGVVKPQPKVIAKLSVSDFSSSIPNAVQVGSITVDEDYRGMGLAKALYGIVLSIMKKTLIAGGEQTPGGRRNWLSLVSIPGVEIKGFVQIDIENVEFDPADFKGSDPKYAEAWKQKIDKVHDNIMKLGGQFMCKDRYSEFWAFDVVPGKGELKPAIKTALSTLYSNDGYEATGLYARWTGK